MGSSAAFRRSFVRSFAQSPHLVAAGRTAFSSWLPAARRCVAVVAAVVTLAALVSPAAAQFGYQNRAVGGVMVDSAGVLQSATLDQRQETLKALQASVSQPQGALGEAAGLRMISLRGLQDAMAQSVASGQPLSDELRYLAGLQRIEYVFVYPERHDVVIAGPAEPWTVRGDAVVVGARSGRPVLQLDDLLVALRSVETARQEGITCSIEPTAEGRRRLQDLLQRVTLRPGQNPAALEPAMREAFGPQLVLLSGVPADSRYARTLVAADYQMKRLAMALEESPVAGMPSYLALARNQPQSRSSNPRWWMACDYDALTHSDDKLAWRISGQGVKTLTETDLVAADGSVSSGGKADRFARQWAETMTAKYDQLAEAQAVFGELRNCFDMSVVATLIVQEQLADVAGCDLSQLMGTAGSDVERQQYAIPKAVEPQCSFIRGNAGWTVTASGGVDVNAFEIVQQQQLDPAVAAVRQTAAASASSDSWWWNG